jgi:hypothetical protein
MGKVAPALADIDPVPSGSRLIFSKTQREGMTEATMSNRMYSRMPCRLAPRTVSDVPTDGTRRRDER